MGLSHLDAVPLVQCVQKLVCVRSDYRLNIVLLTFTFQDECKKFVFHKHTSLSSTSNVCDNNEGPGRAKCQLKKPIKGQGPKQIKLLERPKENSCSNEGASLLALPNWQINDFLLDANKSKFRVGGQTQYLLCSFFFIETEQKSSRPSYLL